MGKNNEVRKAIPEPTRHFPQKGRWLARIPCPHCGKLSVEEVYPGLGLCYYSKCGLQSEIPDDARREYMDDNRLDISVVYYLQFGDRAKIGTTKHPAFRFREIPHDQVLAWEPGGYGIERKRHKQFVDLWSMGEWFYLGAPLQDHIRVLRKRLGIPQHPYKVPSEWRWYNRAGATILDPDTRPSS